ncbi:hypothetical protein [Marinobacter xestospongiae]|uniref:Uncharacterized protein n=1 Tax=Marinobacter xestospongiae TaxID=994319 RepID=A0ABU3W4G2_9GAMM|nr:hypothetical protein [Marinobacter xestospongiae]MDV2081077.1 hypothetical protein [Marinobacter xestospongiae]
MYIESSVGCSNLDNWHSYRERVENYQLPHQDEEDVKLKLLEDGEDLFYKGMSSLSEGIASVATGRHSWAVVKFYYSVFYFLRSSLASKGFALIKNRSQYLWEIRAGKVPLKRSSKRYRNDHVGIINIFDDLVGDNDLLLTNTIHEKSVYLWLMELRHQIHYRQRDFLEPDFIEEYEQAKISVDNSIYSNLLDAYYDDEDSIFCFDAEHACIAAPLKRAALTKADLMQGGIQCFSTEKLSSARNLLKRCILEDSKVFELFEPCC